jgi:hypothetical protein
MPSPCDLIKLWLIAEGLGVDPATSVADWPVYTDVMPDNDTTGSTIQDDVITVYDTQGMLDGRYMHSSLKKTVQHPGVMIRIRGNRVAVGGVSPKLRAYNKAKAIFDALDGLLRYSVTVSSVQYIIHDFKKTSDLIPLGIEGDSQRRYRYSMNGVISWGKNI